MSYLKNIKRSLIILSIVTLLSGLSSSVGQVSAFNQASTGRRLGHQVPLSQTNPTTSNSGSNSAVTYYNWSGYAATSSNQFNAVKMTYIQPRVSCPVANAWTVFWTGFDGFTNGTVEQDGTEAVCGTVGSQPTYYAWWEMYPTNYIQIVPMTVQPGNSITATVTYNPSNRNYLLSVANNSNRQSFSKAALCGSGLICARESAEWIIERPTVNGVYTPLADWVSMQVNSAQASYVFGKKNTPVFRPISYFNNTPIDMVNDPYTGEILASVGSLNTTGNGFTDTWLNAQ